MKPRDYLRMFGEKMLNRVDKFAHGRNRRDLDILAERQ
jgi:hypothetical protein